jgi:predicted membrane protein
MALESAYSLFIKNIQKSLLMGLLIIAVNVLVLILSLACFLVLVVIFLAIGFSAYLFFAKSGVVAVLIFGIISVFLLIAVLLSWYMSFIQAIWTLFFQEISLEKQNEKLLGEKNESAEKVPTPEII